MAAFFPGVRLGIGCLIWGGLSLGAGAGPAPRIPEEMCRLPPGVHRPFFSAEAAEDVSAFLLDRYPVTNAEFLDFVRAEPAWRRSRVPRIFADANYLKHWESDLELGVAPPKSPVVRVSWFAAAAYAEWKGKRLPTLAEWEYAASEALHLQAEGRPGFNDAILRWYSTPTPPVLPSVGTGSRNIHGVRDLHGLAWEWVDDFNTSLVTGESRGDGGLERRLFCGSGSLGAANARDYGGFMRYAMRSSLKAAYSTASLGFRCARDIPEADSVNAARTSP